LAALETVMPRHTYPALDLQKASFPEYEGKPLRPLGKNLHLQVDHKNPLMIGRIHTARDVDKRKLEAQLAQAKVLAAGPEVDAVKVGDVVLIRQHEFSGKQGFDIFKDGTCMYPADAVACVVEFE